MGFGHSNIRISVIYLPPWPMQDASLAFPLCAVTGAGSVSPTRLLYSNFTDPPPPAATGALETLGSSAVAGEAPDGGGMSVGGVVAITVSVAAALGEWQHSGRSHPVTCTCCVHEQGRSAVPQCLAAWEGAPSHACIHI